MECKFCNTRFASKQSLQRHNYRKHRHQTTDIRKPPMERPENPAKIMKMELLPLLRKGPKFDERFKHPFTCIVTGPTKAGKTEFVKKFVVNVEKMMTEKPKVIYWCYTEWQPTYQDIPANFVNAEQLQTLDLKNPEPKLVILDDMMKEGGTFTDLFTKGSHHWNMSLIHITQDLFYDRRRTNRMNTQYLVMMKNPGDKLTPSIIARQMGNATKFMKAYNAATVRPHGYLLVDMAQNTPDLYRLRTNIFPDRLTIFY